MPARTAFGMGRTLIVPSRAESLPYVVLEAAGAHIPMIATNVGGIPEIFGPVANRLIPCNSVPHLADAMIRELGRSNEDRARDAATLADFVTDHFTISNMVTSVLNGYSEALHARSSTAHPVALTTAS